MRENTRILQGLMGGGGGGGGGCQVNVIERKKDPLPLLGDA